MVRLTTCDTSISVSILTRPEGRVQCFGELVHYTYPHSFNPHPARRPGAMRGRAGTDHHRGGFNPHPARRPGAMVQRMTSQALPLLFQSSPGPKAGCNRHRLRDGATVEAFQSSPGPKAGCNILAVVFVKGGLCFNPHPARRPGAMEGTDHPGKGFCVSILTRPEGRVQCSRGIARRHKSMVSILTRPEGRVQSRREWRELRRWESFNPHPARRPGAIRTNFVCHSRTHVSILTRPEGRVQWR